MRRYMVLIYDREADYEAVTPEGWASLREAHNTFQKAVVDLGGSIRDGLPLDPTTSATSIRGGTVTDGPFVEAKEALGGYYVLEARDLDHALEIAKLCPAPFGGVEVRPVPDLSADPAQ
jgi:hypothetical protein